MSAQHRHLPRPGAVLPGVLYLVLLAGLWLADWLASLRGDETRWLAPLAVAGLAVALAGAGPLRSRLPAHRRSRTIPLQRPPRD